jgi:hypothetical protein
MKSESMVFCLAFFGLVGCATNASSPAKDDTSGSTLEAAGAASADATETPTADVTSVALGAAKGDRAGEAPLPLLVLCMVGAPSISGAPGDRPGGGALPPVPGLGCIPSHDDARLWTCAVGHGGNEGRDPIAAGATSIGSDRPTIEGMTVQNVADGPAVGSHVGFGASGPALGEHPSDRPPVPLACFVAPSLPKPSAGAPAPGSSTGRTGDGLPVAGAAGAPSKMIALRCDVGGAPNHGAPSAGEAKGTPPADQGASNVPVAAQDPANGAAPPPVLGFLTCTAEAPIAAH